VGVSRHRDTLGGWHQPDELAVLASSYENDTQGSATDALILQPLMAVGMSQDRSRGIDAHERVPSDEMSIVWTCAGGRDKTTAERILKVMGLSRRAIAESFDYFEEHGGNCDCEILMNVDDVEQLETDDDFVGLYTDLCDVVERAWQRWPVDSHGDDPLRHTSDYARSAANRILDIVREHGVDVGPS